MEGLVQVTQLVQETKPLRQGPEHFSLSASQQRHFHYSAGHKCKFNKYGCHFSSCHSGMACLCLGDWFQELFGIDR